MEYKEAPSGQKKHYVVIGLATIGLVAILLALPLALWLVKEHTQYQSDIQELRETVASLGTQLRELHSSPVFQGEAGFEQAVANTLENLAKKRISDLVESKNSKYQLASEDVPADKSIYGNVNARFTLVEFSDLECPYCKRFHETPKQIVDASKGNINWQWMHLPLDFHNPAAKSGALAAECVRETKGNRAFWVFIDDFFKHSGGGGKGVDDLVGLAESAGADRSQIEACLKEGRHADKINQQIQLAAQSGINGTPATFIVDNATGRTQLLSGAQPVAAFMAAIQKLVSEQEEETKPGAS